MVGTQWGGYRAARVADRVYWVGAIDWTLRDFHGYRTSEGSTYNAYLILAERVTLVDTVKAPFIDEMMSRIASVLDPKQIQCIISNHSEMDHSGALPEVLARVCPEEVIASGNGVKALQRHFHWDVPVRAAADGERLDLGNSAIRFFEAKMLHWPDSMFAYLEDEGVLFSNDVFGMHLASLERFVDELDPARCMREATKYYANIVLPYSNLVLKLVKRLPSLELNIKMIATDHGPIWRRDPEQIVKQYARWAEQAFTRKAVVIYDTMWNSTEKMARAVTEGLGQGGVHVEMMPLRVSHRSDVITELLDAGAILVGSPTLNGQVLPTVADVMNYVTGLKPQNLVGGVFGSYGWGGQSVKQLETLLREMKVEMVAEGVGAQYVPDTDALDRCRSLGMQVAAKLDEKVGRDGAL